MLGIGCCRFFYIVHQTSDFLGKDALQTTSVLGELKSLWRTVYEYFCTESINPGSEIFNTSYVNDCVLFLLSIEFPRIPMMYKLGRREITYQNYIINVRKHPYFCVCYMGFYKMCMFLGVQYLSEKHGKMDSTYSMKIK